MRYGGNTSCLEVRCGSYVLILDAGTGLRMFDQSRNGAGPLDADVFFTHTHLDHICGWPYFASLLDPETALNVWCGNLLPSHTIGQILGNLLREPFMPVQTEGVCASLDFRDFKAGEVLNPRPGVALHTAPLNHPQGATGYRIEFGGKSICYITDTEHKLDEPDRNILGLIEARFRRTGPGPNSSC